MNALKIAAYNRLSGEKEIPYKFFSEFF